MGPAYNPTIKQYSTWEINLSLKHADGTAFVLTDYSGRSQIRSAFSSDVILGSPTVTITNPTNGLVKVHLSIEQTAALSVTDVKVSPLPVWDVLIANTDQTKTFVVAQGRVTVEPGVTRWQE
jgi:hypothetical protein